MNQLPVSPILLVPIAVTVLVVGALMVIGKVPLGYNLRNLVVRWWMTLLTAVAFAFVIGLLRDVPLKVGRSATE